MRVFKSRKTGFLSLDPPAQQLKIYCRTGIVLLEFAQEKLPGNRTNRPCPSLVVKILQKIFHKPPKYIGYFIFGIIWS